MNLKWKFNDNFPFNSTFPHNFDDENQPKTLHGLILSIKICRLKKTKKNIDKF